MLMAKPKAGDLGGASAIVENTAASHGDRERLEVALSRLSDPMQPQPQSEVGTLRVASVSAISPRTQIDRAGVRPLLDGR